MSQPKTASEAVQNQLTAILEAITLLQKQADTMTSVVDPDSVNWSHVGNFAHVADAARCVIERLS